jgi:hypothetical protein
MLSSACGQTVYDAAMERTSPRPRRGRRGAAKTSPAPETLIDEPEALPPDAGLPVLSPVPAEHEPVVPLATPEPAFAARVPPPAPEPEPPLPASRRAIFFDVENTSSPGTIARVIEHLAIDRLGRRAEFVAVGNWRVIGQDTGRLLASHGAQLVHSAPSAGVRDWSDLRIAVSAGVWLAAARPGDVLEIVSDDRAFDAVGDVAAALGIAFRRLSSRGLAGAPEAPREVEATGEKRRPRGGRGRRGGRAPAAAAEPRRAEPRRHEPAHAAHAGPAHTTPHDELLHIVRELAQGSPNGAVLIDTLSRTLKARGFARPAGSPRLVTRLRRMKELAVSPTGMITLVGEPARAEPVAAAAGEAGEPEPATARRRRRGRRGGRGRRRAGTAGAAGA